MFFFYTMFHFKITIITHNTGLALEDCDEESYFDEQM